MEISSEIELVYEPRGIIRANLLFIHGVGHDWKQAWRRTATDTTWIQHQLPIELPFLRMGCWGCTVREPSLVDFDEVQRAANKLLKDLQVFRKNTFNQPIIFVAHSLGGVVLKQALVTVSRSNNRDLLKAVAGILFLSVPLSFQKQDSWNTFLNKVCIPNKTSHGSLEENSDPASMRKSSMRNPHSSLVAHVHKPFGELLGIENIWTPRVYSICENLPVFQTGILVQPRTAIIPGYKSKIVAANHLSITFLDRDTSPLYHWICNWLGTISRDDMKTTDRVEADLPPEPEQSRDHIDIAPDGRNEVLNQLSKHSDAHRQISYALLLEDEGYYKLAESAWEMAIQTCETAVKGNELATLFCRDKSIYNDWHQGNYVTAESKCYALAKFRENHHPRDQHGMLATIRNKVLILRSKGKLQEAYETLAKSLENTWSSESSSLSHLPNLHLLAILLNDLRYHKFSEFLSKEVVHMCYRELGMDHPYTLKRMSDLSVVFTMRGKAQKANEYNLRAYKGLELRYGMHHPAVLRCFKRHGMNMLYQGKYDEACEAFETLIPRYQDKMGDIHPACLSAMSGLATAYILQGQVERGKRLLKRARDLQVNRLKEDHPATIWSRQLLEQLDSINPQGMPDQSVSSVYKLEFESFLQEMSRRFDGNPSLVPSIELMSTGTDEQKFRIALLQGTDSKIRDDLLKQYAERASSFLGGLIHIAAYSNNLAFVRRLLALKVDVNQRAGVFQTPIKAAAVQGNTDIVRELLEHQHTSKLVNSSPTLTPLDTAIIFDEKNTIKLLLSEYKAISTSIFGEPLLQAVEDANVEVAKILLNSYYKDPQLPSGLSHKNPLEEAANIAHDSLVLLHNISQQSGLSGTKYKKNLRSFEVLFQPVFDQAGTYKEPLGKLGPAEGKYIESLQARAVIFSEEPLPAYESREPLSFPVKPVTILDHNRITQVVLKVNEASPSGDTAIPVEASRTKCIQAPSANTNQPLVPRTEETEIEELNEPPPLESEPAPTIRSVPFVSTSSTLDPLAEAKFLQSQKTETSYLKDVPARLFKRLVSSRSNGNTSPNRKSKTKLWKTKKPSRFAS